MVVPSSRRETSDESLGFNDKPIHKMCHHRATLLSQRGTGNPLWILTIDSLFARSLLCAERRLGGVRLMVSNQRFYLRRAAEERTAAQRAITPQAREWHSKLAQDFARRAIECGAAADPVAVSA
jgi:hypothetical protein